MRAIAYRAGVVLVVVALGTSACHRTSPTAPVDDRVDGRWTGTMRDRWAGTVRVELDAIRRDQAWSGTFRLAFDDPAFYVTGSILGESTQDPAVNVFLSVETAGRDCPEPATRLYLARLIRTGPRLSGTYEPAIGCPVLTGGSIELTRR